MADSQSQGEPGKSSGLNKAALLVLGLDQKILAPVLRCLKPDEVSRLMQYVESHWTSTAPPEDQIAAVSQEFLGAQRGANPAKHLRDAFTAAFGIEGARRMQLQEEWRVVAEQADPAMVASLLQEEGPQAIAIVLAQLPPRYSGEVLSRLPIELQSESINRLCRSDSVAAPALDAVLGVIQDGMTSRGSSDTAKKPSGIQRVAALLSQIDSDASARIIEELRSADPQRAEAIEGEMFRFEDIVKLDFKALQMVLVEIKSERLAVALKGMEQQPRDVLLKALSETNAKIVMEEIDSSGSVRRKEVQTARREIINAAVQLDRDGKITLKPEPEQDAIS